MNMSIKSYSHYLLFERALNNCGVQIAVKNVLFVPVDFALLLFQSCQNLHLLV